MAQVKAEQFAEWSIDELCYTRDEAAEFCRLVKEQLHAPRLTRPYILRSLVGLRKNKPRAKPPAAEGLDSAHGSSSVVAAHGR